MKNLFKNTAIVLVFLTGTFAYGQSINFKAGYTASTILNNNDVEGTTTSGYDDVTITTTTGLKNIGGFNVALGHEFRLGDRLSLETGLNFQNRGYIMTVDHTRETPTETTMDNSIYSIKSSYLDIPVVLNTAITTGDLRLYARTGLYLGYMTSYQYEEAYTTTSNGGSSYVEKLQLDLSEIGFDQRLNTGLLLGLGAEYKGFYFETNYGVGPYTLSGFDFNGGLFNQDLSFSLGYKLKYK